MSDQAGCPAESIDVKSVDVRSAGSTSERLRANSEVQKFSLPFCAWQARRGSDLAGSDSGKSVNPELGESEFSAFLSEPEFEPKSAKLDFYNLPKRRGRPPGQTRPVISGFANRPNFSKPPTNGRSGSWQELRGRACWATGLPVRLANSQRLGLVPFGPFGP